MAIIMRDLTPTYINFRRDIKSKKHRFSTNLPSFPNDGAGNLPLLDAQQPVNTDTVSIEMTSHLPPQWVDLIEEAQEEIEKINEKISLLQKAQQRRLLVIFDDASTTLPDKEIQALTAFISDLFVSCEKKVQLLASTAPDDADRSEITLRKNGQKSIATQLQKLSITFRKQQKEYLNETKKRSRDDYFDASDADSGTNDFEMPEMQQDEMLQRNEEIGKITGTMIELNSIFKDLATLVVEQGTVLDCIDYNMEQVVIHTESAKKHLIKAEERQGKGCAFWTVMTLSCILAALILGIILKHIV